VTRTSLRVSRCERCHSVMYPAKQTCSICGNLLHDEQLVGNGHLVTWTVVHQGPPGFSAPYVLAWATLDNLGIGVLGRLNAPPGEWLQHIHVGQPVSIWEERNSTGPVHIWMEVTHD